MEKVNFLDGSEKEQTEILKRFFGLSAEQSFQDLDIDEDDED